MSLSAIPKLLRDQVFERDAGRCQYCGLAQLGQVAVFHINHVVPRSKGGATALGNLVLQCPYCSLHKSDKLGGIDPLTGQVISLFHPLREEWREHFQLDSTGRCHGVSATGRVTVLALGMNDSIPVMARAIQIHLGLLDAAGRHSRN